MLECSHGTLPGSMLDVHSTQRGLCSKILLALTSGRKIGIRAGQTYREKQKLSSACTGSNARISCSEADWGYGQSDPE